MSSKEDDVVSVDNFDVFSVDDASDYDDDDDVDDVVVISGENDAGVTSDSSHNISDGRMDVVTTQTSLDRGDIDTNSTPQYYYKIITFIAEETKKIKEVNNP